MARVILLLHRYLGIGVGVMMVMWCLSGVVMMYVDYPALSEGERSAHLEPIAWTGCCSFPAVLLTDAAAGAAIEMLAGRPVLYFDASRDARPIDLLTGSRVDGITVGQAAATALRYAPGAQANPRLLGRVDRDQWTVAGDFNSQRPLYRFGLDDAAGTELYVSSVSGRAVQMTTARERFWNWLGAVPHWLYFTELRRHPGLWSQIVVYTSLLGCFLAGIGIYLGVRQMLAQPDGRWSPYAGFNLWHHAAGLVFGIFALSWVLSGLLSMNPWGWLEGAGAQAESARIEGTAVPMARLESALQTLSDAHPAALALRAAPLNGRLYFVASLANGTRLRLDAAGAPTPLVQSDFNFLSAALQDGAAAAPVPQLMTQEDDFYFSRHGERVALPVYRTSQSPGTRYYLDPVSGSLLAKFDAQAQAYRWLHQGLHRWDVAAALRTRPRWDVLMLLLMGGVTLICSTGVILGYRRVTRKSAAVRS